MKCRAMRLSGADGGGDADDIRQLAREIGLTDINAALTLVGSFYPDAQLEPKVRFGIEEVLCGLHAGAKKEGPL